MSTLPPCPYATPNDDDLTGVVTHLTPRNTRTGEVPRNPNEPEVRWLLEAGLRALTDTMLADPRPNKHVAYANSSGFFDTLPLEKVMGCYRDMCLEQGHDPGSANKARLIRRWSFAANYQRDLIAYLFRPSAVHHRTNELANKVRAAFPTHTLGGMTEEFSLIKIAFPLWDTLYRLQHTLRIMFPGDTTITAYARRVHEIETDLWIGIYQEASEIYGLTPKGYTSADLAALMRVAAEGCLLIALPDDPRPVLSNGVDLLTTSIQAVLSLVIGKPWDEIAATRAVNLPPEPGTSPHTTA